MNIGLFSDSYFPEIHGVASSIQTLRDELEKKGHHVYVFTSARPDATKTAGIFRLPSMPFVFLPSMRFAIFYTLRAAKSVKRVQLDIIHTQTEFSLGIFGKLMAFSLQIPVVHTYHTMYKDYAHYVTKGHFVRQSNDMVKVLTRAYCSGCRMIIAPTQKVAQLLKEYSIKRPIRVIPSGIKLDRFMEAAVQADNRLVISNEFNLKPNQPIILYIGRVAKEKSIDVILHALPDVLRKLPNCVFLVIGNGPEKETLQQLVISLHIENSVLFAGSRPWVSTPKYYAAADVFVSASKTETQGLTILEAMASGTPVLARNDLSFSEMVSHRKSGLLFDDSDTLAAQLIEVLSDKELSAELTKNARKTVQSYSAEVFGERVEALYKEAISLPLMKSDIHSYRIVGRVNKIRNKMLDSVQKQFQFNKKQLDQMRKKVHSFASKIRRL